MLLNCPKIKGSGVSVLSGGYLKKRLLRIQVGYLLSEGPGNSRTIPIAFSQRVQVDDDLYLDALTGSLVLTRTKEGILAQGALQVAHTRQCDRCLSAFTHHFELDVAELFALRSDASKSEFYIDSNGEIDLAPLLREEVLIEESYRAVCKDGCRGLSAASGNDLNEMDEAPELLEAEADEGLAIDPRLAVLKQLLL